MSVLNREPHTGLSFPQNCDQRSCRVRHAPHTPQRRRTRLFPPHPRPAPPLLDLTPCTRLPSLRCPWGSSLHQSGRSSYPAGLALIGEAYVIDAPTYRLIRSDSPSQPPAASGPGPTRGRPPTHASAGGNSTPATAASPQSILRRGHRRHRPVLGGMPEVDHLDLGMP